MRVEKRKRYVLLSGDAPLDEEDLAKLVRHVENAHGPVKAIPVKGAPASLIVKTDHRAAAAMRESCAEVKLGPKTVRTVLTSGSIGKLKRRALESVTSDGQVPE